MEFQLLTAAALIFLSILLTPASIRVGAPLLLLFLAIGMIAGENGPGGLKFDNFNLAYDVGSLALAVILFTGGLTTPITTVRAAAAPAIVLATIGVVLTSAIVGIAAVTLMGFPLFEGLLLGAVVGSTDAAATFMLLQTRGVRLKGRIRETLLLESGLNDPTAIFLTVMCVTLVDQGSAALSFSLAETFLLQLGLGLAAGVLGGGAITFLLNRLRLSQSLAAAFALAGAMMIFAGTQLLQGSGFLAIYLCGIILANKSRRAASLALFHDTLAWLSQVVMFLMLGLLVTPSTLPPELWRSGLAAAVLMFVARPLAMAVCLKPMGFGNRETLFIGWVGLRGAVPIFLAIIPVISPGPIQVGFFNIIFIVVVASLVLQGWSIPWIARRLGVDAPPDAEPADTTEHHQEFH